MGRSALGVGAFREGPTGVFIWGCCEAGGDGKRAISLLCLGTSLCGGDVGLTDLAGGGATREGAGFVGRGVTRAGLGLLGLGSCRLVLGTGMVTGTGDLLGGPIWLATTWFGLGGPGPDTDPLAPPTTGISSFSSWGLAGRLFGLVSSTSCMILAPVATVSSAGCLNSGAKVWAQVLASVVSSLAQAEA